MRSQREAARSILIGLYRAGLIETLFHCRDMQRAQQGWTLKSGIWSPLYINLRPIGAHPELLAEIGAALAEMIHGCCPRADLLLGVHMAGIPLATAAALADRRAGGGLSFAYTRPFPGGRSPRTPEPRLLRPRRRRQHGHLRVPQLRLRLRRRPSQRAYQPGPSSDRAGRRGGAAADGSPGALADRRDGDGAVATHRRAARWCHGYGRD